MNDVLSEQPVTVASLVEERQKLKGFLEQAQARFAEACRPHHERIAAIDSQCMQMMQQQGVKSLKTEFGTAIISQTDTCRIRDGQRDQFLDFCLDHWEDFGGAMLQIGAPKAEAVREYMQLKQGALPPHTEISSRLSFSVRKV